MYEILFLIIGIIVGVFLAYLLISKRLKYLSMRYRELDHSYKSISVKHGQAWENFVPFMPQFRQIANENNFTFIGMPIDGIAFEDDAIKFIEIKTGKSQLSEKQKKVKDLVERKKVEWHELRF